MRLVFCLLLAALPALANPIVFSMGGTWGTITPSSPYFASGEPWTLAFEVDSFPTGSSSPWFTATYSNPVYTLNGVLIPLTGYEVNFYTTQSFSLCLDNSCSTDIDAAGGPLFGGTVANPTFLAPGNYPTSSGGFTAFGFIGADPNTYGNDPGVSEINIAPLSSSPGVPEPATWSLMAVAILAGGWVASVRCITPRSEEM